MSQNGNRAAGGDQGAADFSADERRQSNPYTLASRSSPTEMPETAMAYAYAEALARREGRS
jgi:hypothetical protein